MVECNNQDSSYLDGASGEKPACISGKRHKRLGKDPSSCVMIGDFPQDVQAGKNAGTKTIAILGLNAKYTRERLIEQKPDALLSNIQELPELFPSLV